MKERVGDEVLKMEHVAYLGLGSNMGETLESLRRAIEMLSQSPGVRVVSCSSVYSSEPVGYLDQAEFLNGVVKIETELDPRGLLELGRSIEDALGRERGIKWGPRTIDVDILLFDEERIASPELTIPHPRMKERIFVLVPLLEVAPDAQLPDGEQVKVLVEDLGPDKALVRIDEGLMGD